MAQCLVVESFQNYPKTLDLDIEDDFEFINYEDAVGLGSQNDITKPEDPELGFEEQFPEITHRQIPFRHQYGNDESKFIEFMDYEDNPQWRRKDEARINAKKKIKNYQVKIVQDHVLVRKSLKKWIPTNVLKSIDAVYSVAKDVIIFYGNGYDDYCYKVGRKTRNISKYLVPVFIKVWIKPSKEFLEQTKPFYEHDEHFKDLSDPNEFNKLWASREYENYKKMSNVGIKVPKLLFFDRNVLIYRYSHSKLYDELGPYGVLSQYYFVEPEKTVLPQPTLSSSIEQLKREKKLESIFGEVVEIMKDLYNKAGLIHGALTPESILKDGCLISISQAIEIYYPGADKFLFQDCKTISDFFSNHGLKSKDNRAEGIFESITGYEFKSPGQNQNIKTWNNENELIDYDVAIRKLERKSNRSMQQLQELTKLS